MRTLFLRLVCAFGLLAGGVLLSPAEALPDRSFTWRNYVDLHIPPPALDVAPQPSADREIVTVKGSGFAPERSVYITLNRERLTDVSTNAAGEFTVQFDRRLTRATTNEISVVGFAVQPLAAAPSPQIVTTGWSNPVGEFRPTLVVVAQR